MSENLQVMYKTLGEKIKYLVGYQIENAKILK
jgi:hypothetical protein